MALDGGRDGLEFYRNICNLWTPKLKAGGVLAFEIGLGQFEAVRDIMQSVGVAEVRGFRDINNIVRAVIGKKQEYDMVDL